LSTLEEEKKKKINLKTKENNYFQNQGKKGSMVSWQHNLKRKEMGSSYNIYTISKFSYKLPIWR